MKSRLTAPSWGLYFILRICIFPIWQVQVRFGIIKHMENYLLVAVATGNEDEVWESLDELAALLETAGGYAVEGFVQKLEHPDPATYIGSGKAREIAKLLDVYDATGIICDDELSPMQLRNLSELMDCAVLDRTMLILDIFALHAKTREGKLQVEMAQLKYRASHLTGMGKNMSRLGGGIGTRGPGETKLETDRRAIRRRIGILARDLKDMEKARNVTRKKRGNGANLTAAIVGYTNAGKSTLLNRLSGAGALAEDMLFATLDPLTRVCRLPDGEELLLTDTVGFINKLPHQLIDAFRSTLEEAKYADIIIHVVDSADANVTMHMDVVYRTLSELGVIGKPILTVFNKSDLFEADHAIPDDRADVRVYVSAKAGGGIDELYKALETLIHEQQVYVDTVIPYTEGGRLDTIRRQGHLLSEEYEADGIHIRAYVPKQVL